MEGIIIFIYVKAYIYTLSDPESSQIRYVGKSIDPKRRLQNHLCCKDNTYVNHWIKKLRSKELRPIMNIIENCSTDNWNEYEIKWISYYKNIGLDLCNHTIGGEGYVGAVRSKEVRERISKAMKGKPKPIGFKPFTTKLSIELAREIKFLLTTKMIKEVFELVKDKGVSFSQINEIRSGRTWKNI